MPKKRTHEEFKQKVFDIVGSEYKLLNEYINSEIKVRLVHAKCGNEYSVSPNSFLRGRRCPLCFGKFKKTTEEFKKEVFEKLGNEYEVVGDYKNNKTKVMVKHDDCGHEYEVRPNDFLSGSRCPQCFGTKLKTTRIFKQEVFNLSNGTYKLLGAYVNSKTKVKIRHLKCLNEYEVMPQSFLNGRRCSKCAIDAVRTQVEFERLVKDVGDEAYEVLGEYKNNKTKVMVKHTVCKHEWEVIPSNFLKGSRCPVCTKGGKSKGEVELTNFIRTNYDGEIIENDRSIIPSMITNRFYEIDIYIPEINLAIEYNGKYWHDRYELETPGYHAHKQRICDEKWIKLINVDDGDWNDKKKINKIKENIITFLKGGIKIDEKENSNT